MSTQDANDIPINASYHRQAFKLLELPLELQQLLESASPPTLYLKSDNSSSPTDTAYAILSSPNKTYRIQQKNSSNPIMILESSTDISYSDDPSTEIPISAVRIIATIEDTVELYIQENENAASAPPKVNKWHDKFAKSRKS